jgi:hypothetical protein
MNLVETHAIVAVSRQRDRAHQTAAHCRWTL